MTSVNIKLCTSPHWQSFTRVTHNCVYLESVYSLWELPRESAYHLVARKRADGLRLGGRVGEWVMGGSREAGERLDKQLTHKV